MGYRAWSLQHRHTHGHRVLAFSQPTAIPFAAAALDAASAAAARAAHLWPGQWWRPIMDSVVILRSQVRSQIHLTTLPRPTPTPLSNRW